ncbi:ABC transporter [Klebsiella pneumoniae]|uniref:Spermidine/putrescine-binding periplasmic protein n=1 Tax=Klebsiella pneumoniae TaxID=573 RepID=A0A447S5Y2_KLEPN|nr:ABC transporter [Klebsiella pneumoniae]
MLQKIDKSKLTNFSNLDPQMLNKPFDPNNDYSIPYIWGATAIGVNSEAIDPKTITSWADLWKPEYKSSLLLTDDAREVFQMALRKLGYSGNTTDPKEIEAAYNELKKLMPNVAAFNSDNPANPYMEGEVNLGMVWNGSAYVRPPGRYPAGSDLAERRRHLLDGQPVDPGERQKTSTAR